MVDGSWMAEFTENGVLANLSEMGYSFDDDIIPATTTICKVGEDIYLAPYYGNVTVMMYNKQLLADAGYAPEDIDSFADLMDIAQKTKAADSNKNGFLIRGGSADNILSDFLPHLVVHGGWVVDEKGKQMHKSAGNGVEPSEIIRDYRCRHHPPVGRLQRLHR